MLSHNHSKPQEIPELSAYYIDDISVGPEHSLALGSGGEVWGWGHNADGQLGLGHMNSPVKEPTRITGLSGVNIRQVGHLTHECMLACLFFACGFGRFDGLMRVCVCECVYFPW